MLSDIHGAGLWRTRRPARLRTRSPGLAVRHLEQRILPALYVWIGPAGGSWFTPANWSHPNAPGPLPGPNDAANIDVDKTVVNCSAPGKTVNVSKLELDRGTLSIGANTTIVVGGGVVEGGYDQGTETTLNGPGTLIINTTRTDISAKTWGMSHIEGGIMQGGGKTIVQVGVLNISGLFTLSNRELVVSNTNTKDSRHNGQVLWDTGTITLAKQAQIAVTNGGTFFCGNSRSPLLQPLTMVSADGTGAFIIGAGGILQNDNLEPVAIYVPVSLDAPAAKLNANIGTLSLDYLKHGRGIITGSGHISVIHRFGELGTGTIGENGKPGGVITTALGCISVLTGPSFYGWELDNYGTMFLTGGKQARLRQGASIFNNFHFIIPDGSGMVGDKNSKFVNQALFQKLSSALSVVDVPFLNNGAQAVVKQWDSTLWLMQANKNLQSAVKQDPSTIKTDEPLELDGATLEGTGNNTILGDVFNAGYVLPGGNATPGGLSILSNPDDSYPTGNYIQASGSLGIDIGGPVPIQQYDQVNIAGTAVLGGTLAIGTLNGFWPTAGQSFVIMTFASFTGGFSQISWPQGPPGDSTRFTIQYNPTNVTLVAVDKPFPNPAVVTSVLPSSGPTGGGTTVTIGGSNFTAAYYVTFGGVEASSFTVNSDTSITAVAPPHVAATVDVQVYVPGGPSQPSLYDQYTYLGGSGPNISGTLPNSGSVLGNTAVTINGTGFTGASAVTFGGVAALSFTVNSDSSITAVAPSHAAGTVDIAVTTPNGTSGPGANDQYTYQAVVAPVLGGLAPLSGSASGGTWVNITGSNFSAADGVFFGDQPASQFIIDSPTLIAALAPPDVASTVDVTVTSDDTASAVNAVDRFTFTGAAGPVITSVGPTSGSAGGGTVVSVSGSGFTAATSVNFRATPVYVRSTRTT